MRLFPLVFLLGCFDGATTTVALDLKAGTAQVVQQLHNASPDEVGCDELPMDDAAACVDGIRQYLDSARGTLVDAGATIGRMGVVLAEGELDFLYEYDAPVGAKILSDQGLTFLWMEERTPAQVRAEKPGKRRVALVSVPTTDATSKLTVDGKYRMLSGALGDDKLEMWLFRGAKATVRSEWTYTPTEGRESPGAWLRERPGLEDALRASGLVVTP